MSRYDFDRPTRAPLPPPFPVGTKLRCIDKNEHRQLRYGRTGVKGGGRPLKDDEYVTVYAPGIEVVIDQVKPGRRGTGREVDLGDGGDPFVDSTRDGYSVYHIEGTTAGRIIGPEDAHNWEIVK